MSTIRRAAAGETYEVTWRGDETTDTLTVVESCGKPDGRWRCCTHGETFRNQLEKDHHIGTAEEAEGAVDHVLAWVCYDHGLETP